MKTGVLTFVMLAFAAAAALGQRTPAEIRQIDALARQIESRTKLPRAPKLIFADVSDYRSETRSKWQRFASEAALEKHRDRSEAYSIAYAWQNSGKVEATNFTLFTPSGDWAKYVFSYYRSNGTLAKVEVDYRTFYGDLMVLQKMYFNTGGKLLRKTNEFRDLQTRKLKKPDKDTLDSNSNLVNEKDYYLTTSRLPFAHLLKNR